MTTIEDLYAEVYANPDDDQLRHVLADALIAVDDPRGELILYQLEPAKDYHRRAMRLIQAHGLSWLGPLRGKVIPLGYERGFLASVTLLAGMDPDDFDEPIWSTVHTIDVGQLEDRELAAVRITPAMRSLKTLIGMTPSKAIALRTQPIDQLQVVLEPDPQVEPDPVHYDAVDE